MDDASEKSIAESSRSGAASSIASSQTKGLSALGKPLGGSGSFLSGVSNPHEGSRSLGSDKASKTSGGSRSPSIVGVDAPPGGSASLISLGSKRGSDKASRISDGSRSPLNVGLDAPPGGSASLLSLGSKRRTSSEQSANQSEQDKEQEVDLPGDLDNAMVDDELSGRDESLQSNLSGSQVDMQAVDEVEAENAVVVANEGMQTVDEVVPVDDVVENQDPAIVADAAVASMQGEKSIGVPDSSEAPAQPKKGKAVAALMKGLRSGAVAKIVDDMEASPPVEQPPGNATETMNDEHTEEQTQTTPYIESAVGGQPYRDSSNGSEDVSQDNEMDEDEFARQCQLYEQQGSMRRSAVCVESRDTEPNWKPPQYQKSEAQFEAILAAISNSVIFASLFPEDLRQIAHAFKGPSKVVPGAAIIQEEQHVDLHEPGFFLLERGSLKVFKRQPGVWKGGEKARGDVVGAIDKPWSSFGEVALLHNCPRTATVIANAESVVWSLDRETFQNCVILAKQQRKEARIKFLESIELLRGLTPDERLKLCEVLQTRFYRAGDMIITQGEPGTDFFLLEEGAAHAVMGSTRVKDYGPHDFFGELALMHQQPRIASVIADATPTVCATLDAGRFKRLLGSFADVMSERCQEYEATPRYEEDQEEDVESEMGEEEFQRQEAMMREIRLRGRRAIVSEHWFPRPEWSSPFYQKTQIQYDLIQNTCLESFLFQNLAAENMKQVVDAFKGPSIVPAGKQICLQGTKVYGSDPALYIMEKGSLDVFKTREGESRPGNFVRTLDRVGSAFGELHLVEICARPITVKARTDCVLWSIDRETFNYLVKNYNNALWQKHDRFLSSVELFRNVSPEQRSKLVDVMQLRTYSRGQYIIRKGDLGSEFFVLQEGSAIAMINGQRVREYGPSQYFGELALMYRQPRAADILASAHPTVVAVLTTSAFSRILGNLQTLMAERATEYTSHRLGVSSWIVPKRDVGPEWLCNAERCNFRNFGRSHYCLKCGKARPNGNYSEAIVPFQASTLQVHQAAKASRPALIHPVPAVAYALELSGAQEGQSNVIYATYPRRVNDVGIVQGAYPMVPGEYFQVTVQCLGTFGEISVGLAPSAKMPVVGQQPQWLRKRQSSTLAKDLNVSQTAEPAEPRGASMVGWGVRELGFTGDHGIWCFRGRLPGPKVSEPWKQGDLLECGIDHGGGLYMKRNGVRVDKNKDGTGPLGTDEYWPAEDSYPTVTFHSGGAEVLVNLSRIARKPEPRAAYDLPPADTAKKLLSALRRTVIPGAYSSSFWSWCSCSDVQIRRPETSFQVSSASPGRSGHSSPWASEGR